VLADLLLVTHSLKALLIVGLLLNCYRMLNAHSKVDIS
jgi:hypothetical protein